MVASRVRVADDRSGACEPSAVAAIGLELLGDRCEHGAVELLLAREVIDERRERQVGRGGEVPHARAVKPALGEQLLGGRENVIACALAFRRVTAELDGGDHVSRTCVPLKPNKCTRIG